MRLSQTGQIQPQEQKRHEPSRPNQPSHKERPTQRSESNKCPHYQRFIAYTPLTTNKEQILTLSPMKLMSGDHILYVQVRIQTKPSIALTIKTMVTRQMVAIS